MVARVTQVVALAACVSLAGVSPAAASDDTYFGQQWNLQQIGAPAAWATSKGAGVLVGVVDSGIDANHPDLTGKIAAQADCVGGPCREGSARDGDGHGTAVAGVIAARADNGAGIAGVAPDAKLVVARALDNDGAGTTEDINAAIQWVVDHGARVVNLSLGDNDLDLVSRVGSSLTSGVEYAWSRGAIPVLAAGNYERGVTGITANYGNLDAVVVGATTKAGDVSRYSTSLGNAKWGIVAPGGTGGGSGVDVLTTAPGGRYAWAAGTSLATPHVSGALALLLAGGRSPAQAVAQLLASADHSKDCGVGCKGRLAVDQAVAGPAANAGAGTAAAASPVPPTPVAGGSGGRDIPAGLVVVAIALIVGAAAGGVGAAVWRGGATSW